MLIKHTFHFDSLLNSERRLLRQTETPKPTPDTASEKKPERPTMEQVEQKWKKTHEEGEAFLEAAVREAEANKDKAQKGPQATAKIGEVTYADAGGVKKFSPEANPSGTQVDREAETAIAKLEESGKKTEQAVAGVAKKPDSAPMSDAQIKQFDAARKAEEKPKQGLLDRLLGRNKEEKKEKDQS